MKQNIALLFGGYSGEFEVSVQSSQTIGKYINRDQFQVFPILISREKWFYSDEFDNEYEINKNDFSLSLQNQTIHFDKVFIAIHGTPGEDGKLQGYFDMLQIPYSSCDQATSSLTFNKYMALGFIKSLHLVKTAESVFITSSNMDKKKLNALDFPVFVKPNNGGSSVGMSKVNTPEMLEQAIEIAFKEDDEILVEEFIEGREITCGLYQKGNELIALPITEIISKKEYFDFEAKYDPNLAEEIVPANIPEEIANKTKNISKEIYQKLNCKGLVRIDYIFNNNGIYFLEVNTIPGMSEASIVPKMVKASDMHLSDFVNDLINQI